MGKRPWDREELDWAREAALCGFTAEDVAEMAGRAVDDVRSHVQFPVLTAKQRLALQMYQAGFTLRDIGLAIKPGSTRPDSLGAFYARQLRDRGLPLVDRRPGPSLGEEAFHG